MATNDQTTGEIVRRQSTAVVEVVTNSNVSVTPLPGSSESTRTNNSLSGNQAISPATGRVPDTPRDITGQAAVPVVGTGSGIVQPLNPTPYRYDQVFPDIESPQSKKPLYRYPSNLPDRVQMIIKIGRYDSQVALGAEGAKVIHDTSIALPIPSSLLDTLGLDYNTIGLGMFGGPAAGAIDRVAGAVMNGNGVAGMYNNALSATRSEISRLYNNGDVGNISQAIISRAINAVSGSLGAAFNLSNGATPNPHIAVNFNNVRLRTFNFSWKFSPNSQTESQELVDIINVLQKRSLPEKKGVLLEYPSQCQLQIYPAPFGDLFKFKPCVIENISVNYAPTGIPSFFVDTQLPTEIDLSISLQEIVIRTASDYDTKGIQ